MTATARSGSFGRAGRVSPSGDRTRKESFVTFPSISHVALTVTDLEASAAWYERLLCVCPVLNEDAGPFWHTVYPLAGGTLLGLHRHRGPAAPTGSIPCGPGSTMSRSPAPTATNSRPGRPVSTSSASATAASSTRPTDPACRSRTPTATPLSSSRRRVTSAGEGLDEHDRQALRAHGIGRESLVAGHDGVRQQDRRGRGVQNSGRRDRGGSQRHRHGERLRVRPERGDSGPSDRLEARPTDLGDEVLRTHQRPGPELRRNVTPHGDRGLRGEPAPAQDGLHRRLLHSPTVHARPQSTRRCGRSTTLYAAARSATSDRRARLAGSWSTCCGAPRTWASTVRWWSRPRTTCSTGAPSVTWCPRP